MKKASTSPITSVRGRKTKTLTSPEKVRQSLAASLKNALSAHPTQRPVSSFINRYAPTLLIIILAFAFLTRIYRIDQPQRYIFDEVYHALTAKLIARNDPQAFEWWNPPVEADTAVDWLHPPLAKYTQAFSMLIFGENTFGWRLSSVIFGVLVILMTAKLAYVVFEDNRLSLLAAFLASLDGLLLAQSRIAMNDIHVTFFILLSLFFYARHRHLSTNGIPATAATWSKYLLAAAVCAGLAMGTKWSGLFALMVIWLYEAQGMLAAMISPTIQKLKTYHIPQRTWQEMLKQILVRIAVLVILPFTLYVAAYTLMFMQGKSLFCHEQQAVEGSCYYEEFAWNNKIWYQGYVSHFVELHRQIWWYQTTLTATHPFQSRPVEWFFNLRPVWFDVEYLDNNRIANIYTQGNPVLLPVGALLALISMIYLFGINGRHSQLLFVVVSYFAVWLPWQLSPRIMFFYHYTPAIPLLCILISYWFWQLWDVPGKWRLASKSVAAGTVIAITVAFVVWFPNWTGLPVPQTFAENVYFAIPSWR